MKNYMKFLIVALLLGFFTFTQSYANDQNDWDNTVNVSESKNSVTFSGAIAYVTANATGSHFTQGMSGSWLDWENAVISAYSTVLGNEDVNIFLRGSAYKDSTHTLKLYTQTALDDINTVAPQTWYAFKDTISQAPSVGISFDWYIDPNAYMPYKLIEFEGMSGNPNLAIVTWVMVVPKKSGAPRTGAFGIWNMGN